jgi:hypothetical protein
MEESSVVVLRGLHALSLSLVQALPSATRGTNNSSPTASLPYRNRCESSTHIYLEGCSISDLQINGPLLDVTMAQCELDSIAISTAAKVTMIRSIIGSSLMGLQAECSLLIHSCQANGSITLGTYARSTIKYTRFVAFKSVQTAITTVGETTISRCRVLGQYTFGIVGFSSSARKVRQNCTYAISIQMC